MKHGEFYQFYKQSTEKKWRTKPNIIATIETNPLEQQFNNDLSMFPLDETKLS